MPPLERRKPSVANCKGGGVRGLFRGGEALAGIDPESRCQIRVSGHTTSAPQAEPRPGSGTPELSLLRDQE